MEIDIVAIGQRIREARKKKGLSQEGLAQKVVTGTSVLICKYEKGKAQPSLSNIAKIAAILEVDLDYLVFGKKNKQDLVVLDRNTLSSLVGALAGEREGRSPKELFGERFS